MRNQIQDYWFVLTAVYFSTLTLYKALYISFCCDNIFREVWVHLYEFNISTSGFSWGTLSCGSIPRKNINCFHLSQISCACFASHIIYIERNILLIVFLNEKATSYKMFLYICYSDLLLGKTRYPALSHQLVISINSLLLNIGFSFWDLGWIL